MRAGNPSTVIPVLAEALGVDEVRFHDEPGTEEANMSVQVRDSLLRDGTM